MKKNQTEQNQNQNQNQTTTTKRKEAQTMKNTTTTKPAETETAAALLTVRSARPEYTEQDAKAAGKKIRKSKKVKKISKATKDAAARVLTAQTAAPGLAFRTTPKAAETMRKAAYTEYSKADLMTDGNALHLLTVKCIWKARARGRIITTRFALQRALASVDDIVSAAWLTLFDLPQEETLIDPETGRSRAAYIVTRAVCTWSRKENDRHGRGGREYNASLDATTEKGGSIASHTRARISVEAEAMARVDAGHLAREIVKRTGKRISIEAAETFTKAVMIDGLKRHIAAKEAGFTSQQERIGGAVIDEYRAIPRQG